MAVILDLILLTLTCFVGAYVAVYFLPLSLPFRLILSALIAMLIVGFARKLIFKPNGGKMSYRKYVTYLIWQGEDCAKKALESLCADKRDFRDMGEYVTIDGIAVFLWTKYGAISADTMVKFYRTCKSNNISKAYILTTNGDKKTKAFIKNFGDVALIYTNFKPIYNALKKREALPPDSKYKISAKQTLSMILQTAFTRKNGFRFIGVTLLLLAISFVTPFANYYIAIASVNLCFAIACMAISIKNS